MKTRFAAYGMLCLAAVLIMGCATPETSTTTTTQTERTQSSMYAR